MFDKIQIQGETTNEETIRERTKDLSGNVVSEETVVESTGDFSEITVQCGNETLTLKGEITKVLRSQGLQGAIGVRVHQPGRPSFEVTSLDSERLVNHETGEDLPFAPGTTVQPIKGGNAF